MLVDGNPRILQEWERYVLAHKIVDVDFWVNYCRSEKDFQAKLKMCCDEMIDQHQDLLTEEEKKLNDQDKVVLIANHKDYQNREEKEAAKEQAIADKQAQIQAERKAAMQSRVDVLKGASLSNEVIEAILNINMADYN